MSVSILSTGEYLPNKKIFSYEIDRKYNKPEGWTSKKSSIKYRFFTENETASFMAYKALMNAISRADIKINDIECLIIASATTEQSIPTNTALVLEHLYKNNNIKNMTGFDVCSTCLSFLTAFDIAANFINSKKYNTIAIVSADHASNALDFKDDLETAIMFGDGAAAAILQKDESKKSRVIASHQTTYPEGARFCEIRAGGSKTHPDGLTPFTVKDFYFKMQGHQSYKLIFKYMPKFIHELLERVSLKIDDIDYFIFHQASNLGLKHAQKILNVPDNKFLNIHSIRGNQVAASLPTALHHAVENKKIKRGDHVLLFGSGAGISLGGIVLEY